VEDVHHGRLRLEPSDRGARFVMILPAAAREKDAADDQLVPRRFARKAAS
jgi:hypothetical protein